MIPYRPMIEDIPLYEPGKPIEETERELGIKVIAKLASNENPYGVSPIVKQAIQEEAHQVFLYPDAQCYYLGKEIAALLQVSESRILLGAGSEEVIDLIAKAYFNLDDEVIMSQYAFVRYPMVTQMMGARSVFIPCLNYVDDFAAMARAITPKTRAIILSNPNNPLGSYVSRNVIEEIMPLIPEEILVIFDDAYYEYVWAEDYPQTIELQLKYPNIISLRTFSKIYGLAGLRLGYAVGDEQIIRSLKKVKNVFSVSLLAQAAGLAALKDREFINFCKESNQREYEWLSRQFDEHQIDYVPSQANFILISTAPYQGIEIYQYLLKKGIIIRPVAGYGLPGYVRVTIGTHTQNERFIHYFLEALKS